MGNSAPSSTAAVEESAFEEGDAGRRVLLVSDSLDKYELLIQAASDSVIVVPVKFDSWTLADVSDAVLARAGQPSRQYASVGLLDHGEPDELCLLKSVGGGILGFRDIIGNEEIEDFFRFLASYVMGAPSGTHRSYPEYRLDLMACSLSDALGLELIDHLEGITGVNVAASLDNHSGSSAEVLRWSMAQDPDVKPIGDWYFDEDLLQLWEMSVGGCTPEISLKKAARKSSGWKQMTRKPQECAEVKIRAMERHRMIWKTKAMRESGPLSPRRR
eukprot:TRINITY_DN107794_c0_g1_i1.p1 TRINITY_DN107794_c0_g1~~TRINITY_DN107794_c0_g1_i1.p1  ORF type:complete len:281 (-),score=59.37 TRINITY_DN107794_c0_g1_i1:17-835(-)